MNNSRNARATRTLSNLFAAVFEVAGILTQLLLLWIGARVVWGTEDLESEIILQVTWCIVASVYLGVTIAVLALTVRVDRPDTAGTRTLLRHPAVHFLSTLFTFGASVFGIVVALDLVTDLADGSGDPVLEVSSVWALLLSWALFNWGFARIYYSRYYRAADPPLDFPDTLEPRIADFAYFAFTNATSFSVSDVHVRSTRMRWTVVWHTTFSFFFNALIIALVLNLITSGALLSQLLD